MTVEALNNLAKSIDKLTDAVTALHQMAGMRGDVKHLVPTLGGYVYVGTDGVDRVEYQSVPPADKRIKSTNVVGDDMAIIRHGAVQNDGKMHSVAKPLTLGEREAAKRQGAQDAALRGLADGE